mgnify:CR=1 FL=1
MRRYTDSAAQRHVMVAFWTGVSTSNAGWCADHAAGQPNEGSNKQNRQHGNDRYSFPSHSVSPYTFFGFLNAFSIIINYHFTLSAQ